MHALTRPIARLAWAGIGAGLIILALSGCHKKATESQCNTLVDRYAELAMKEQYPDAGPTEIEAQKKVVRDVAKNDDDFKNCTSEVETADFDCAMKATTTEGIERCLE